MMNYKFKNLGNQGQSLVEVIFALAVALLAILALVRVTTISVKDTDFAKKQAQATAYAQEGMERIRAYRDQHRWETFLTDCGPSLLGSLPSPFNPPTVICNQLTLDKMEVTVTVSWTGSGGTTHQSRLVSYFTRW